MVFFVVLCHEPCSGEARPWLLLHNLTFAEMIKEVSCNGNGLFFYFLLYPFVRIGMPPFFMQFLCWLASSSALFLLYLFSPFPLSLKIVIALSAPFLYFFPVTSGCFSFVPLLLFLSALAYPDRRKHPLRYLFPLAFLANTHFVMTGFVAAVFFLFYRENFRNVRTYSGTESRNIIELMFFSLIVPVVQIVYAVLCNDFVHFSYKEIFKPLAVFFLSFFENLTPFFVSPAYVLPVNMFLMSCCAVVMLLLVFLWKKLKDLAPAMLWVSLFTFFFQLTVYNFLFPFITPDMFFCWHAVLIFCFWLAMLKPDDFADGDPGLGAVRPGDDASGTAAIAGQDSVFSHGSDIPGALNVIQSCGDSKFAFSRQDWSRRSSVILLEILFIATIPSGMFFLSRDISGRSSGAADMASYIKNSLSREDVVFSASDSVDSLVFALNGRPLLFNNGNKLAFSGNEGILKCADLYSYSAEGKNVYLVFHEEEEALRYTPVHSSEGALIWKENYYLARIYPEREYDEP